MNCVTSALSVCQIEYISSMYLFRTSGLRAFRLRMSVSTAAIKLPDVEKSFREISSSSDDISARYSLPQNFQSSEHRKLTKGKQALRDLLRRNNETRYQSSETQIREIFITSGGQNSPFPYFSINTFFYFLI